jgi:hypothetical protein
MRLGAKKRKIWVEAAVLLLLAGGAVAAFIQNETKPMGRDELKIAAADLRSLAAGGKELTNQHLAGNTTETFFENQSELMRDNIKSTRETLEKSRAEGDLELKRWETAHLGKRLETAFESLNTRPQEREKTRDEIEKLFVKLRDMEASLKQ